MNKQILLPVKQEEFIVGFGGNKSVDHINPMQHYQPLIEQFKKLATGPYFWFVVDAAKGITIAAGGMLEKILALKFDEFVNHPPDALLKVCHPEDIQKMFAFTNHYIATVAGLPAKRQQYIRPTIYMRQMSSDKTYKWTSIQYTENILDAEDRVAYGLTLVTDISHIKKDGVAMMSILDAYDESCQHFFCTDGNTLSEPSMLLPKISSREVDVLRHLAIGYSSKQIASELNIAIKTIDNHRQNLLKKTNTKSSSELVAYAINNGLI